jgi:hypothetical protein
LIPPSLLPLHRRLYFSKGIARSTFFYLLEDCTHHSYCLLDPVLQCYQVAWTFTQLVNPFIEAFILPDPHIDVASSQHVRSSTSGKDYSYRLSLCILLPLENPGRLRYPSLHSGCLSYSLLASAPAIPRSLRRNSRQRRRPTHCYGLSFHWESLSGTRCTSRRLVPRAP